MMIIGFIPSRLESKNISKTPLKINGLPIIHTMKRAMLSKNLMTYMFY